MILRILVFVTLAVALPANTSRTAPRWPERALPRAKNLSLENI